MNYFLDFWIWASPSIQSAQDTAIHCPAKSRNQRTRINTGKSVCQCLTRQRKRRDLIQSTVVCLSFALLLLESVLLLQGGRGKKVLWQFCYFCCGRSVVMSYLSSYFLSMLFKSLLHFISLSTWPTDSRPWNKLLLRSWVRPGRRWCGWWQPGGGEESISSRFGAKKNTTTTKKEERRDDDECNFISWKAQRTLALRK